MMMNLVVAVMMIMVVVAVGDGGGGDGDDDDDVDGGGKSVSLVALVFQESQEREGGVRWLAMNYNQFATEFPQTGKLIVMNITDKKFRGLKTHNTGQSHNMRLHHNTRCMCRCVVISYC